VKLKNLLQFALLLNLAPALAIAAAAEPFYGNYEKFELTKAEIEAVAHVTAAKCPKKAGGPKFQVNCRAKLMAQSDMRLNASYKHTMSRLSKPARENLRAMEKSWLYVRYEECVLLSEDSETNPRTNSAIAVEYYDCALVELKRRTHWLDLYR
jgi:uncharacterized protein YecT (DUF1311 family)